jgi:hypothetical protein
MILTISKPRAEVWKRAHLRLLGLWRHPPLLGFWEVNPGLPSGVIYVPYDWGAVVYTDKSTSLLVGHIPNATPAEVVDLKTGYVEELAKLEPAFAERLGSVSRPSCFGKFHVTETDSIDDKVVCLGGVASDGTEHKACSLEVECRDACAAPAMAPPGPTELGTCSRILREFELRLRRYLRLSEKLGFKKTTKGSPIVDLDMLRRLQSGCAGLLGGSTRLFAHSRCDISVQWVPAIGKPLEILRIQAGKEFPIALLKGNCYKEYRLYGLLNTKTFLDGSVKRTRHALYTRLPLRNTVDEMIVLEALSIRIKTGLSQ